ncbi:Small glutamine-rich tetratricopeptide repeat-containing protein 2 [Pleurotus ostreatus]|nr:Small glutamine-rich tetratricopeptide repeat-containing protein 2 [Pleurotus ostreatus]
MSNKQKLALAIIDFLNQAKTDGSVSEDAAESLDVAVQCISDSFQVDPSDASQVQKLSVKPATLQSIFNVFLQTKDKVGSGSGEAAAPTSKTPSAADKTQAEKFKQEGNSLMSSKKYDEAIDLYTKAVNLDPTNPVYYSNRAAAHSSKGDHLSAVGDAEKAIEVDPKFTKAYHRLGHAQYSLADYKAAASAFERGLELDPANASFKSGLSNAKARIVPDDDDAPADTAPASGGLGNMSGMADMLRGMGGGAGGGGGGMPDLASLMNNPQMMAMAQQMMANGGLAGLMQNPAVADMMNRVQSGNMPSMEEIMANPALRNIASQFGGAGGPPGQ